TMTSSRTFRGAWRWRSRPKAAQRLFFSEWLRWRVNNAFMMTVEPVQRLCGVDELLCKAMLDALVDAKFLRVNANWRVLSTNGGRRYTSLCENRPRRQRHTFASCSVRSRT